MVERIRTLLETRQLTPTQFADAIGIARPIVSHILSGRNKPSLEVVQRILAAMPDLSMPWLLNGTGPMLATATPTAPPVSAASAPAPQPVTKEPAAPVITAEAETELLPENQYRTASALPPSTLRNTSAPKPAPRRFTPLANKPLLAEKAASSASITLPEPETPAPTVPAAVAPETAMPPEPGRPPMAMPQEPASAPEPPQIADATTAALFAGAEKPIRRIVIFYRDGSFADYQPE